VGISEAERDPKADNAKEEEKLHLDFDTTGMSVTFGRNWEWLGEFLFL